MSDVVSEYTLLVVESPTLAARLQELAPGYVYVFSTSGFLWEPVYNSKNGYLGKKALPGKLELRNELRREARQAIHILIATDSDPSGDFIAWTIHKELHPKAIKRAHLKSVSSAGITDLLKDASAIDFSTLFKRLQNRYRIRQFWATQFPNISMRDAGLMAVFGAPVEISGFLSDDGYRVTSNRLVKARFNQSQTVIREPLEPGWSVPLPLSTFDVVAGLRQILPSKSFTDAQDILQRTFEATHPQTGEGLITYPRTEARSFFQSTWHTLQQQWIRKRSLNEFIPNSLRETTNTDAAHDSIRPLQLEVSPDWVEKHLPSDIGKTYRYIHSHTFNCIKFPSPASAVYKQKHSDAQFLLDSVAGQSAISIRPFISLQELGYQLCSLGVLRPSAAGSFFDNAIKRDKITVSETGETMPGPALTKYSKHGPSFSAILKRLRTVADDPDLNDETIQRILSS